MAGVRKTAFKLVAGTLTAFGAAGCGNAPAPAASAPPKHAPAVAASAAAPPDASLASADYMKLGFPADDRPWTSVDMAAAATALAKLHDANGCKDFPRRGSPRSGAMFARMNAPENLKPFRNRSLPLDSRFPTAMDYQDAVNRITKLYFGGMLRREVRDSEVVDLFGTNLRITAALLGPVEEFLPTLKKDDPSYPVRMAGLKRMRNGMAQMVVGSLMTLGERTAYRGSELVRLVEALKETAPTILTHLPPETHKDVLLRLGRMQDDPKMQDLQPGLGELLKIAKAAPPPSGDP